MMHYEPSDIVSMASSAVVENMKEAVIVLDGQKHVIAMNPSARRFVEREGSKVFAQTLKAALLDLSVEKGTSNPETEIQKDVSFSDNGDERLMHLHAIPICDDRKNIIGYVIMLRDVTLIKQATKALSVARMKSEQHSNLRHELRTPLNGILGLAEMLDYGAYGPMNEDQRKATQQIMERIDFLTQLLNNHSGG